MHANGEPSLEADVWILGIVWYFVLLFSLTFHEAAHAWAALRGGDPTAYHEGQVGLDPIPHIRREPFGTVLVPIFFYATSGWMIGWASTPYDPSWARAHPRRAAWMALAGPVANGLLVVLAAIGIRIGVSSGAFAAPLRPTFSHLVDVVGSDPLLGAVGTFLSLLFMLNLLLLVFNLIPVPPLDGSGVLGLFVPEHTGQRLQEWMAQPGLAFGGIVVAWLLIPRIFGPIHLWALHWLHPGSLYQ